MEKQIIKEMLWESFMIGGLFTAWIFSIVTPITYEHIYLTKGHLYFIYVIAGILIYKIYELIKQWKKINIYLSD